MNGIASQGVGPDAPNGIKQGSSAVANSKQIARSPIGQMNGIHTQFVPTINGTSSADSSTFSGHKPSEGIDELPLEIRQRFEGAFLPLSILLERYAQECWNGLSLMVEQLATAPLPSHFHVSDQVSGTKVLNGISSDDQSKENLDRKDRLLSFASDQKANFIKQLVLLQWSKDAEAVSVSLHLNLWLSQQRQSFLDAAWTVGSMKRQFAIVQIPNPDLQTACEVLSLHKVPSFPDLHYLTQKPLTPRQMLQTLRSLNKTLCSRLVIFDNLPPRFQTFRIHDGRATFSVPDEFELDVSVVDEDPSSQFYFVGFRFSFFPSTNLADGSLQNDVRLKADELLRTEGLSGCYEFLHDMVLSYKLNILYRQALDLLHEYFASSIRVELIRRTLVVHYWCNRPVAKSWIEIGITSGRQTRRGLLLNASAPDSFLQARWIREQKEVEIPGIELDLHDLSINKLIGQVLALHTNHIFEAVYDNLIARPLYVGGDLLLEQTASSILPGDCQLEVQLSMTRTIKIAVEPVTGVAVLSPATLNNARVQQDLRSSRDLVHDLSQRLVHLRCTAAEQELVPLAERAGWDIVRAYKPTSAETNTLFNGDVLRHVMLRQAQWESKYAVVATYGATQDCWWLMKRNSNTESVSLWTSRKIEANNASGNMAVFLTHLTSLADYVAGLIVLESNAEFLSSVPARFLLPSAPKFDSSCHLPKLSFEFAPEKGQADAPTQSNGVELNPKQIGITFDTDTDRPLWIDNAITLSYRRFDHKSGQAVVVARGRSTAPRSVLKQVATAALDPSFTVRFNKGDFSIRLCSVVGRSVIEHLIRQISCLESLIASLTVLKRHPMLRLKSVSLSHLSVLYAASPAEYGFVATLESPSSPAKLEFWPKESNPLVRIAGHLSEAFADPHRSLPTNLSLIIPLVTLTSPLLACLQSLQDEENERKAKHKTPLLEEKPWSPRMMIMPRHATMYGIHYFAPAGSQPTMPLDSEGSPRILARLEILPTQRSGQLFWILRPALEEFETYNRPSFSSEGIRNRMREEIFSKTDEQGGWLPLGDSAVCHVTSPQRLFQTVHELMTAWVQGSQNSADPSVTKKTVENGTLNGVMKVQPTPKTQTPGSQKPQASVGGQSKGKQVPNSKGSAPKRPDVIMLDD